MSILEELAEAVELGKPDEAIAKTQEAIELKMSPLDIMNKGLIVGMDIIAEKWSRNEVFIPEILVAAMALTQSVELLKPLLLDGDVKPVGKAVIGTAKGDLHDIGKNLVKLMMTSAGFEMIDLGTDVSDEDFVTAVKENGADILMISALLTTTMTYQKLIIESLEKSGLRDQVKVMVGGAPVSQEFADDVGADGFAVDAVAAVKVAKKLLLAS
ncbi:corrinoid protein [Clostridia bacterium]|nr:corrinoid protein [Clostridia bacterium]